MLNLVYKIGLSFKGVKADCLPQPFILVDTLESSDVQRQPMKEQRQVVLPLDALNAFP